jgi:hypothetical protein
MRNGIRLSQGDIDQLLFAIGYTLANRTNYITGFADANTNLTTLITNNDDRAEAQLFAAFDNLADATDLDNPLLPGGFFLFSAATFSTICHSFILNNYGSMKYEI